MHIPRYRTKIDLIANEWRNAMKYRQVQRCNIMNDFEIEKKKFRSISHKIYTQCLLEMGMTFDFMVV